jgi:Na+/melibiose symporter-like transporter
MVALTIVVAALYAPTIPLIWTMYADVADYSEWQTGRRFTGITFATICFALKCGLALGSSAFLWVMALQFHYDVQFPDAADSIRGFRFCSGIVVGFLFLTCAALLANYQLNKRATLQLASDLTVRRSSRNAALKV